MRGGGDGDDRGARLRMGGREAVDIAAAGGGIVVILFITLHAFNPLPEPWRTVMGATAFAIAVLSIARYAWNMLGGISRHKEIMDALKRHDAKLDAILEGQRETNRLLRIIAEAVVKNGGWPGKGGKTAAGGGGGDTKSRAPV